MRFPEAILKMNNTELNKIENLPLTEEERYIVNNLRKGYTVQRISYDLSTSDKTVYRRIGTIKNKLEEKGMCNNNNFQVPICDKFLLTIPEASAISNIGQTKLNELVNMWNCSFVFRVGTKRLIKKKEFLDFISKTDEV